MPILLIALVTACAAPGFGEPQATPTATEQPTTMPPSGENDAMTGQLPDEVLAPILADAVDRTGVAENEIEILRAQAVNWNDGSLGCPQPGMMYTQALVDGYHVELRAAGVELDYRSDQRGNFILCDNPQDEGRPSS